MNTAEEMEVGPFANLPEDEVQAALKPPAPWPAGTKVQIVINSATDYQGEGKPYPCVMVDLTMIRKDDGRTKRVRDWVLSQNPKATFSVVRFLACFGLTPRTYVRPEQLVGLTGEGEATIDKGRDGIDRNGVKYFAPRP